MASNGRLLCARVRISLCPYPDAKFINKSSSFILSFVLFGKFELKLGLCIDADCMSGQLLARNPLYLKSLILKAITGGQH